MVRLTDSLGLTIAVDWDVKPQTKQTKKLIEPANNIIISLGA